VRHRSGTRTNSQPNHRSRRHVHRFSILELPDGVANA
jgi:hypothetical protein